MFRRSSFEKFVTVVALSTLAAGCGMPTHTVTTEEQWKKDHPSGSLFGGDGPLDLFNSSRPDTKADGTGLGVNELLWRASLDTLKFLPLTTTPDPFGGVIVYDWYSAPETPNERFKVNVVILDRQLRADGVRVSVFKQIRDGQGWKDVGNDAQTGAKLEEAILTRARQLRSAQAESAK